MDSTDLPMFERIRAASVPRRAQQFAFLRDLVRIDTSPTQTDPDLAASRVASLIEDLGLTVELVKADGGRFPNLISRLVGGEGPTLAFVSHLDTVAAGDGWKYGPLDGKIDDGALYGLGAISGKGHLAAQVFAILAMMDASAKFDGVIEIHVSFDGENGGVRGAKWLLEQELVKPDMAIVGGPARGVAQYATGVIRMDVDVIGASAPAFAPERGHDALEATVQALSRLYQFRSGLSGHRSSIPGVGEPALVVESISGGNPAGGVPDKVTFRLERRVVPSEDPSVVEKQLTRLIGSTVATIPGVRCRIRRTLLLPPMEPNAASKPLYSAVRKILQRHLDEASTPLGIACETEARFYAAAGIPTVLYGAGPLDMAGAGLYGVDEHQDLNELRLATDVLACSAEQLLRASG